LGLLLLKSIHNPPLFL